MCAIPGLCNAKDFILQGAIDAPPIGGWRINLLPASASHLQNAWAAHPHQAGNAKDAWWGMLTFLASNGVKSPALTKEVREAGIQQWCSGDPKRCRGVKWKKGGVYLPWAAGEWERANNLLAGNPPHPGLVLAQIISRLSKLITGDQGCDHCAKHWKQILSTNRPAPSLTLDQARHWLVDAHNATREGKAPTPYAEVAAKFNWT